MLVACRPSPVSIICAAGCARRRGLPGVFFFYEMSPLCAVFEEKRKGWLPFLTSLCAIIGGVYATGSVVDQLLHQALTRFQTKFKSGRGMLD